MSKHTRERSRAVARFKSNAEELLGPTSGRLFEIFVDAVEDYAIYALDRSGRIVTWNTGAERLTGYAASDVIGESFAILHTDEDRARDHPAEVLASATERDRYEDEGWRVRKDGSRIWVHTVLNAVRARDGGLVGFAKVMQDLTSQRETLGRERDAREVAEAHAREERALRNAVATVVTAESLDDAVRATAAAALDAIGATGVFVTRVAPERGEVELVMHAGDAPPTEGFYGFETSYTRRVMETRIPVRLPRIGDAEAHDWVDSLPDYYLEWALLVVPLPASDPVGALFLARARGSGGFSDDDVARAQTFADLVGLALGRLQAFHDAEQRREELERLSASRTRLIRGLSHDLKNPLGAADGFAALLEEGTAGPLEHQQRESIHRIRRSIKASLDLVEDLVDFARAEAGQLKLERIPVDATELACIVAEDFQARATEAGLGIDMRLGDPLSTQSDPERIKQIIGNLMSNATKYAKEGTITVTAELRRDDPRAPHPGEWIAVDVRDTGPGIPADKQEIVFQEFTRLDPAAQHGAGVGLAISRQIARALGGDITVESAEGEGATFTLWLPKEGSPEQPSSQSETPPADQSEPTPQSPPSDSTRPDGQAT